MNRFVCDIFLSLENSGDRESNRMMEDIPWNSIDFFLLIVLQASVYQTLHGVPNPYECQIGGRRMLGTSGQPIHDIARYSKLSDPLNILQHTLEWAHIAPTCPDTQCE